VIGSRKFEAGIPAGLDEYTHRYVTYCRAIKHTSVFVLTFICVAHRKQWPKNGQELTKFDGE